ncbi:unnamed protein product [Ectocarpus fasciculatus]
MLAGRNGADVDEFDNQLNDPGQYDNPQDPASLSVVEHLRALSIRGKLTLLYVAGVIVFVLCTLDWVIAFACMASFLVSAAPLFAWWSRIRFSCPLDLVVRSFGLGIFAMVWVVYMLFRLCSTGPMGRLLYTMFGRLVGVVVLIILVGLEEMVKVIFARWSKRDVAIGRETKAHQIAATATSIGYSVGFSFFMIIVLDLEVDLLLGIQPDSSADLIVALLALLITTMFGTPMHVLSGYLVGLEVTRQTHFMKVAMYTFLIRSLFMVNIFLWIFLFSTWQPIMAGLLLTNVLICCAMVHRIKKVEATLPVEYLQRVGYLQAFGYGVLPGGDVDEVEIPSNIDVNTLV